MEYFFNKNIMNNKILFLNNEIYFVNKPYQVTNKRRLFKIVRNSKGDDFNGRKSHICWWVLLVYGKAI